MTNFADRVITFNSRLKISSALPEGVNSMNPFKEKYAVESSTQFYKKFYNDNCKRFFVAGINPGRNGAGVTGIPFTDTKRLKDNCGIRFNGSETYEPSSVFVYEVIDTFGGPEKFYSKFYINSICPLGFTIRNEKGKFVNYNYYDDPALTKSVYPFILNSLEKQIDLGLETDICFCLGTGKNFKFMKLINDQHNFFRKVIPLEHPRFVMQYRSKQKPIFIKKYMNSFAEL